MKLPPLFRTPLLCLLFLSLPASSAAAPFTALDDPSVTAGPGTGMSGKAPRLNMEKFEPGATISGLARAARAAEALAEDAPLITRGPKESNLFRQASPAVVLIMTQKAIGSGTVIDKRTILTNWHAIDGFSDVAVVFKPKEEGREFGEADIRPGKVIKWDNTRDLALIRVASLPSHVTPLRLGTDVRLEVGTDVHAIGHPTGEAWT